MTSSWTLPLRGLGGEPVDLLRTIVSHGVASLPPCHVDEESGTLRTTLRVPRGRPRSVMVSNGRRATTVVAVDGRAPGAQSRSELERGVRHMLRLDEDLSGFYELVKGDPDLDWVRTGAGRMLRSASVFEEVVKTVCTTNCAWSATVRMVTGLVEHLGEPASTAPGTGSDGKAFPTPEAMAEAGESFYRDVIRAGYRGPYLISLARGVAEGSVELEPLAAAHADELPDEEVRERLLALPGVGPYAAAHVMLMLGRYSPLILDSWTRPTYARLTGRKKVADRTIERRFRRYRPYEGLAFWLFLTKGWVEA